MAIPVKVIGVNVQPVELVEFEHKRYNAAIMKLHIKLPSIKLSKGKLVAGAVTLAALVSLIIGIGSYQRGQQVEAEKAAAAKVVLQKEREAQAASDKAKDEKIKALEADKAAACKNYKELTTARATRTLVVTPLAVHCPN